MRLPQRWIPWAALVLCAIVAADVTALVVGDTGRSRHHQFVRPPGVITALPLPTAPHVEQTAAPPTPDTISRYGHTFHVAAVPADAARLDPGNSSIVDILAAEAFSNDSAECLRQVQPSAHVVTETDTYVVVATYAYRLPAPTGSRACAYVSGGHQSGTARLRVRLAQPLGDRMLWDAASGKGIGVLKPADPPAPSYLPAGYHAGPQPPVGTRRIDDIPAQRDYLRDHDELAVLVWSASTWRPDGTVTGTARFTGHFAIVTETSGERCVSWAATASRVYEVCSYGRSGFLDADELVRVARSMG